MKEKDILKIVILTFAMIFGTSELLIIYVNHFQDFALLFIIIAMVVLWFMYVAYIVIRS